MGALDVSARALGPQHVPGLTARPPPPTALSHSWTVKQQCVDLMAEGLWEELLDDEQPDITVMDWYVPRPGQPVPASSRDGLPDVETSPFLPFGLSSSPRPAGPLQDPAPPTALAPSP